MEQRLIPGSTPSRLAALVLGILAAAIVWFVFVVPLVAGVQGFLSNTQDRHQLASHLSAYTARQSDVGATDGAADIPSRAVAVPTGVSADEAAATMQSQLRALLARAGYDLQTFEFLGASETRGLERLSMLVQFQAPLDTVVGFLDAVEGQEIGMRIDEMILLETSGRGRRGTQARPLEVSIEVSAFRPTSRSDSGGAP